MAIEMKVQVGVASACLLKAICIIIMITIIVDGDGEKETSNYLNKNYQFAH